VVGPLQGHTDDINSVAFSPDGRLIVSGSDDHTIRIWDTGTGQTVVGPLYAHSGLFGVRSVAFSSDGKRVVSGGSDALVRIWDAEVD
jgi:WD40 repeat protein